MTVSVSVLRSRLNKNYTKEFFSFFCVRTLERRNKLLV